ncbi:uncharacterized transporter YutK-like isoform X2 [Plodia interpunctella]|uniref:uncharacterized transporter YutK-like isoform X2 n=1 Tax=Plodia interpunctella TaxID=58824 RepID=UPI002368DC25|nr:uncharacterized transporter YutK-like isoform X2 [Plodia interpunctella]
MEAHVEEDSKIEKTEQHLQIGDEQKRNGALKPGQDLNGNGVLLEELEYQPSGWLEKTLTKSQDSAGKFFSKHSAIMKVIFLAVLNLGAWAFFIASYFHYSNELLAPRLELCSGFGSLIALFTIIYFFLIYFLVVKRFFGRWFEKKIWNKVEAFFGYLWKYSWFRWVFSIFLLAGIGVFLYIDTQGAPERLISLLGLGILLLLGFVFSSSPGRVKWRTVTMGLLIQFVFGLLFIRWDSGRVALQCFSDKVATFLSYGVEGAAFTFGELLVRQEGVFAFSTLPVIFFFSMLVEVLFFWGALQWFCLKLGRLLRAAAGSTVCESVIAVGNVFLGNTESLLLVKPYLSILTPSELHVLMGSGFATVSGTILAAYIGFGASPAHLVTASVMSAPAAICYCKLLMPETKRSLTAVDNIQPVTSSDQSALAAATRGATNGIALILNIIANLVAFISVIAFINGVLGYCGAMLGYEGFNLEWLFGKIFIPLCWVMGVPWEECERVGALIGLKTVVNEFVAYQRMGEMKAEGLLSARAELIATYSLCGFTNPSSAAIMIGAISAMAPNQREPLSSVC